MKSNQILNVGINTEMTMLIKIEKDNTVKDLYINK